MLKVEQLFTQQQILQNQIIISGGQRFLFEMVSSLTMNHGVQASDENFHILGNGEMLDSDVPGGLQSIASQPDIMQTTLQQILRSSNDLQINKVSATIHQLGIKARIPVFKVETDKGTAYFPVYLARHSVGSVQATETETDFNNLLELSSQFEQRLTLEGRQRYQVLKPIALGLAKAGEKNYPFFTMPFIQDKVELAMAITSGFYSPIAVPYLRYAIDYDKLMNDQIRSKVFSAKTASETIAGYAILHNSTDLIASAQTFFESIFEGKVKFNKSEAVVFNQIVKDFKDLLIGNALIFYVSGMKFPKEFNINAGDWMGKAKPTGGYDMTLISVRGGWEDLRNEDRFIEKMVEQFEPDPQDGLSMFRPFAYISDRSIRQFMKEARGLIKR